jgi:hypothetical protein
MKKMDHQVAMECEEGFFKIGMPNAYTSGMLADEFWALTRDTWEMGPGFPILRETDGMIVHGIITDWPALHAFLSLHEKVVPQLKILEERGRGTLIRSQLSQGKLLRYCAWAQTPLEVGVFFPETSRQIEYCIKIVLPRIENEDDPTIYLLALKELWMERLRGISNDVAHLLGTLGNDFGIEIRYLRNVLRVWFVPLFEAKPVTKRPLAEEPIPKDKWFTPSDLMAFSAPPIDQVQNEVAILFGPECPLQELYPDPEVQGGKIALIAFKQMRAQEPPNDLDRMQSVLQKQVAYNQRIMEAEDEIAGINGDLPRFLWEMKFTEEEQVVICVKGSESMKRNEEQIAGQLWIQEDHHMAGSNKVLDGMANTRDSVVLSAVVEAVAWGHAGEPAGTRKGQRVIVYPKDIPQLDAVLRARDPNIDSADSHPIAYQAILQHSDGYEKLPVFLSEDSEPLVSDPAMAIRVPEWMAASRQIAVGNPQRTLEDGDDKMDSSDEDDPKMQPDVLTGMYTAEMDPEQCPRKLSQSEAASQRAVAQARREQMIQSAPRADSPEPEKPYVSSEPPRVSVRKTGGSSDDDTLNLPEWI